METFNKNFLNVTFIQDNQSFSKKNIIRGLHYQTSFPQSKLVRVIKGKIFDVAVDIRKNSKTFGQYFSIILSEKNNLQLFIPQGFAHGFLSLTNNTIVAYKVDNFYHPEYDSGIIWNDPTLNIKWPLKEQPILSNKDLSLPYFIGI